MVVDRLEGADDERAAGLGQPGEDVGVSEEVLDLMVASKVRSGWRDARGQDPAGMKEALRKSGSAKLTWRAPAATS